MPSYLRLCFAYCAIFPKGHKVAKDNLIYQWASLGFIKHSDQFSIWQLGEVCIKQLLDMLLSTLRVTFGELLLTACFYHGKGFPLFDIIIEHVVAH